MRTATTLAALALSLAVAGCSGDGDGSPDGSGAASDGGTGSAAATAGAKGGSFGSTDDIIAALGESGLPCAEPTSGTFPGVSEAQSCILNDAEDVVLLRFATATERGDYLANKDDLSSAVVGPDWAVQTVLPQTAEQVAAALGGELRLGQGGEQPPG